MALISSRSERRRARVTAMRIERARSQRVNERVSQQMSQASLAVEPADMGG